MSAAKGLKAVPPFDVKDWVSRTTAFAQANPSLAHRALTAGAVRIRKEAQGHPQGAAMLMLAQQLDVLATAARVQEVVGHPSDYGEPVMGEVLVGDDPLLGERQELGYAVAQEEAAMSAPPDPGGDSFVEAQAQVHGAMELQRSQVQPVQVNPASAQFGVTMFGNSQIVQYTNYVPAAGVFSPYIISNNPRTLAQPEAPVIQWNGKDQETTVCNVALGRGVGTQGALVGTPSSTLFLSGAGTYRPYFHMFFGSGQGQPIEVYGDIGRGVQFTVACSRLYVNVGMDSPPAGATSQPGFPGAMQLSGNLGFWASSRHSPVVRTVYVDNLAAGASVNYYIPSFATTLECIMGLTSVIDFDFSFINANGTFLGEVDTNGIQARGNGIVLDDEAAFVRVTNNSGFAASCRMIFGLSL